MADSVLQSFLVKLKYQVDEPSQKNFQTSIKAGIEGLTAFRIAAVAAMVGAEEMIRRTTASFSSLGYLATSAGVSAREIERLRGEFVGAGMDAARVSSALTSLSETFRQPGMHQFAAQIVGPFKDSADFIEKAAAKYAEALKLSGGNESTGAALQLRTQLQAIDGLDFDAVRNMAMNLDRARQNAAAMDQIYDQLGKNLGITAKQMTQRSQDMESMFWRLGETFRISFAAVITNPDITAAIEKIATGIQQWMISDSTQTALKQFLDAIGAFLSKKENIDEVAGAFKSVGDAILGSVNAITTLIKWVNDLNEALKPVSDTLNWLSGSGDKASQERGHKAAASLGISPDALTAGGGGNAGVAGFQHGGIVSALHEGEMVLPAPISEGLQNFFMGGAGAAGSMGASSARLLLLFQGWFSGDTSFRPVVELGDETLDILTGKVTGGAAPGGGAGGAGAAGGFGGGAAAPGGGGGAGGGIMGGAGGGAAVPAATKGSFRQIAMDYFSSRGWSKEQAAGLVANLETESHGNIGAKGDSGAAFGIGQWHPDRQAAFRQVFGKDIHQSTLQEQLAFVDWEMNNTEARAGAALKRATTAQGAGAAVSRYYERPRDVAGNMASRGQLASSILAGYQPGQAPATTTTTGGGPQVEAGLVDTALKMEGMHETRDRASIMKFMQAGGVSLDPSRAAWCAAFVNANLQLHGIRGSGSQVATSFANWGQGVSPGAAAAGDVIVQMRHHLAGQTGGHVGLATGLTKMVQGHEMLQMIAGNTSNEVKKMWVDAQDDIRVRRAAGMDAATMQAHLVGGGGTPGSHLVAGGGASLHRQEVTINVHGNDNPSATAKAVQVTQSRVTANHLRNMRSPVA